MPPAEPSVSGVVLIPDSFENLSIRTGPSTDYTIVGSMNNTVRCNVYTEKTQNGWYYVEYNGIRGYAAGNYIYLPSETRYGIVNIPSSWDNLSIRTGPSTDYNIIGRLIMVRVVQYTPTKRETAGILLNISAFSALPQETELIYGKRKRGIIDMGLFDLFSKKDKANEVKRHKATSRT